MGEAEAVSPKRVFSVDPDGTRRANYILLVFTEEGKRAIGAHDLEGCCMRMKDYDGRALFRPATGEWVADQGAMTIRLSAQFWGDCLSTKKWQLVGPDRKTVYASCKAGKGCPWRYSADPIVHMTFTVSCSG